MRRVKTIDNSDWKDGFLFVGNHLVLDFLNTRPVENGKALELLPDFDALLRWFHAADLLSSSEVESLRRRYGKSDEARRTVTAMRKFRETLRTAVLVWERGAILKRTVRDQLNRLMAEHPMLARLKAKGSACSTDLWFAPQNAENLFSPLARSAAELFADVGRSRVRKCSQCALHFRDTSKKGTRRWCSMQLCGNRLKVAAYAARQRMRAHK